MSHQNGDSQPLEQPSQPQMCSTGCGFFANNTGMCSKCFRDTAEDQQQKGREAVAKAKAICKAEPSSESQSIPIPSSSTKPSTEATTSVTSVAGGVANGASAPPPPAGPSRCSLASCRKRVGLTGFKCKCDQLFCGTHRYAEAHDCEFDYKTVQRQKLAENNPLCVASKVQKL